MAAEPPSRRRFARKRRSRRLPSHTKGVGAAFQPATVSSNQVMISLELCGCWPLSARPHRMRWTDSAMFNHDPLKGVYSGITPCANSQTTIEELKCPARLSQIRMRRSGGSGKWVRCPNQVATGLVVAPHPPSGRLAGQPGPAAARSAAMDVTRRWERWSRPYRAPRRWLDGTRSAAWPSRRGYTHAADQPVCPQVARIDQAAGWPGTDLPHLDTTREYLRLQRRGTQVR